MNAIGFGIIGCGRISESHFHALTRLRDARIVCVADINAENAQRQAEKHGAERWVTGYHELLAMPEVQAVVVCLPTFLHAEVVCAAAAAGKHVLCEKPIAMTLEDADRVIAACKSAGTLLQIGFVRHFSTEWLKLREIIQSGRLGRPVIWRQTIGIRVPPLRWFVDAEKGGGPFLDGCIHDYDFGRFIFGEPEMALGSLSRLSEHSTALDTGTAIVRFRSGDEIVRNWSWGLPDPDCHTTPSQDVIGPLGALRFPDNRDANPRVSHFSFINGDAQEETIPFERTSGQDWFDRQMEHFIDCIHEGRQPNATGEHGRKALEIALAVLQAGASRQSVML